MVEKRPHPADHEAANKRPKPAGTAINIQDKVAEARAKAAAIKARMAAGGSGSAQASPSPAPPAANTATMSSAERLAAMKARMAALKVAGTAATPVAAPAAAPASPGPLAPRFATTLGNRSRHDTPLPASSMKVESKPGEQKAEVENPYFDPKGPTIRPRMTRNLLFNQRGKYLEQASKLRRQTKLEEIKALLAARNRQVSFSPHGHRRAVVLSI